MAPTSVRPNLYAEKNDDVVASVTKEEVMKLFRYLYADSLLTEYRTLLELNCNGCRTGHESQSQHDVCMEPLDEAIACLFYIEANGRVDKQYLKMVLIEACKTLWLDHNLINFDNAIVECMEQWIATDFHGLSENLDVEDAFVSASLAAMMKMSLLEKRFTE